MAEIDMKELQRMWKEACTCITNQDYANAAKLMKVLSCEGYSEAQFYLGTMYLNGLAVEKNPAEAFRLLNSAAHNGFAPAQYQVASMYASGTHVAKDVLAAAWWLLRSAVRGNAEAQFNLGRMYAAGIGVDKNAAEAIWWLHAAAEQGHANAKAMLEANKNPKAHPGTLQESSARAIRALAEKGHPHAMCSLGYVYRYNLGKILGSGVTGDAEEAQRWWKKAAPLLTKLAEQGDADAQDDLTWMYHMGYGVPEDIEECLRWRKMAAENGHARAQAELGDFYFGLNNKAVHWWTMSARQGYPDAQWSLGYHWYYSRGENREEKERGLRWIVRAAHQGHHKAQRMLAEYYKERNPSRAAYWNERNDKENEFERWHIIKSARL